LGEKSVLSWTTNDFEKMNCFEVVSLWWFTMITSQSISLLVNYLSPSVSSDVGCQFIDFVRTWWRLFKIHSMCSKLDILRFNLDPIDQFNLVELEPLVGGQFTCLIRLNIVLTPRYLDYARILQLVFWQRSGVYCYW
jgi:hypothetical protein